MQQSTSVDPGSFRDPDSRVFIADGNVYRALSEQGFNDWRAFTSSTLFRELNESGSIVKTEEVENGKIPSVLAHCAPISLQHQRIPFISYPFEWTFGMLHDAALLHLDLLDRCIDESLFIKDSSPYNIQWWGTKPVYTDMGSFERLRVDEPWIGYRQFCMLFLYPLMLQTYKAIPYSPWLRGAIDGITPQQAWNMMSTRDLMRKGVFSHVYLHSKIQGRYGEDQGESVKAQMRDAGFNPKIVKSNIRKLRNVVTRLDWKIQSSAWTDYADDNSYSDIDAQVKIDFVRKITSKRGWDLVYDLGANKGVYSRIAAESAKYVVAVDSDHATVELLYRELKRENNDRVLPLVLNLRDPSTGLGWRGRELPGFDDRANPELVLALALVHHLAITNNIPLSEIIDWFAELSPALVVEFPDPQDPMVKRLLAQKRPGTHSTYTTESFEALLSNRFEIQEKIVLPSGNRSIYFATKSR